MPGHITALDPPRLLAFTFQNDTEVSIELEEQGSDVLLTLIHRRLPNRNFMLGVSGGWHAHLDVLVARVRGEEPGAVLGRHDEAARRLRPAAAAVMRRARSTSNKQEFAMKPEIVSARSGPLRGSRCW